MTSEYEWIDLDLVREAGFNVSQDGRIQANDYSNDITDKVARLMELVDQSCYNNGQYKPVRRYPTIDTTPK